MLAEQRVTVIRFYVSLCVCVSFTKLSGQNWDFNQATNRFEIIQGSKEKTDFSKTFRVKVMTIFTTHDCRFTTFRRLLVAKEYMKTQLILFEGYCCRITA